MKKLFIYPLILCAFSCQKESVLPSGQIDEKPTQTEVSTTTKKYLAFQSQEDFNQYFEAVKRGTSELRAAQTYASYVPKGFKSIAQLKAEREKLRAMSSHDIAMSEIADEEVSREEFELFRAEEILTSPDLSLALDTTMRVEIGDKLYAITEVGTFVAPKHKEEELDTSIKDVLMFSQSSTLIEPRVPIIGYSDSEVGKWRESHSDRYSDLEREFSGQNRKHEFTIAEDITFINSFEANNNDNSPIVVGVPKYPMQPVALELPNYHEGYDVDTYEWKEKTFVGKMLGKVFGHNIGKEKYFDKKHRAQLYIYDLNFGFAVVTGIKARKQIRKRFLGIKFWKPTSSEKLVVGFNHLYAEVEEKVSSDISHGRYTNRLALNTIKELQVLVDGKMTEFVTQAYSNIEFIKDWAREIAAIVPRIDWGPIKINPDVAYNFIYNLPKKQVISMLHKSADRWVYNPYRKQADNKMPRMGFFPAPNGKARMYALGVQEYDNIDTKTITLNFSGGFKLSLNSNGGISSLSPFVPREVDPKSFDIFVAIKHNGVWKGVRMTHEEK